MTDVFTQETIEAAILGLQLQKKELDRKIEKLTSMLNGNEPEQSISSPKNRMSETARKAQSKRMKAYWAARRKAKRAKA